MESQRRVAKGSGKTGPLNPPHRQPYLRTLSELTTAAAAIELSTELLQSSPAPAHDVSGSALERFRQRAGATEAIFWNVTRAGARMAVRVGRQSPPLSAGEAADHRELIDRLRRRGSLVCRGSDTSAVDALVPEGVRSCVVIGVPRADDGADALMVGWDTREPPCDAPAVSQLRLAALALQRTLPQPGAATPQLNEWTLRLAVAQDEERSRIARELHDDLGQQAALLAANISALSRVREAQAPRLRSALSDANRTVQRLARSIHDLSHQLHPPRLKLLGLVRTLETLCHDASKHRRVRIGFRASDVPAQVPERIALSICRVAQEAVRNAVSHSSARSVSVELAGVGGELILRVIDRGRGFDLTAAMPTGIGLSTMRERIELNGGRFAIDTAPGEGTRIEAIVPLPV